MTDSHSADRRDDPAAHSQNRISVVRLLYALGLRCCMVRVLALLLLSAVQFAVLLVTGRVNAELKTSI